LGEVHQPAWTRCAFGSRCSRQICRACRQRQPRIGASLLSRRSHQLAPGDSPPDPQLDRPMVHDRITCGLPLDFGVGSCPSFRANSQRSLADLPLSVCFEPALDAWHRDCYRRMHPRCAGRNRCMTLNFDLYASPKHALWKNVTFSAGRLREFAAGVGERLCDPSLEGAQRSGVFRARSVASALLHRERISRR
jgi:hypothetical protein